MRHSVTKVRSVFQRTLIIAIVRAAIREKHVRLCSSILLSFLYLLIHFSDHHRPILVSVTVIIQGHNSIGSAVLAYSQIRHDPMMIDVIVTVNNFPYSFKLFRFHWRLICSWKPIVIFWTSSAHLAPNEVSIYLISSCMLTNTHLCLFIPGNSLKHVSCLINDMSVINSKSTCRA